jgi:hypothetical protein
MHAHAAHIRSLPEETIREMQRQELAAIRRAGGRASI